MCGVIGIAGKDNVAPLIYTGLLALQHRGQDGAGILTFEGSLTHGKKGQGQLRELFTPQEIASFAGSLGLGHTRYRTAGAISDRDAHPFLISSTKKLAIVQNGNLVNFAQLKESLKRSGVFLDSTTDAEVIARILAHEYELRGDVFESIRALMGKISGSYSIVGVIEGVGLFAFRDPKGIRPLLLGEKDGSYCFASETSAINSLGYRYLRDVTPGEAILVSVDLQVSSKIIDRQRSAHCMFEWIYFARADSLLDGRSVYNARLKLGKLLAQDWKIPIDVVIPVPDTARTAAGKFAEVLGVRFREGLIKNRYIGRTFIMPTQVSREDAVKVKLSPIISAIKDKRVALFDDSIVRGTTSKNIVRVLREAGAKEVHVVSTCPPVAHPCFYGVDMPTKEELIAAYKSVEEIRQYIGADTLTYLPIEYLPEALKKEKENLCMACLDGKYPVPIPGGESASNVVFKAS